MPPGARIPSDWMPLIITATTITLTAGILYTLYHLQNPSSKRRRRPVRKRHLDIDIDLSNPLGIPPPQLNPHHHLHNTDELLNQAIIASNAAKSSGALHASTGRAESDSIRPRLSGDLDRGVLPPLVPASPWNDSDPSSNASTISNSSAATSSSLSTSSSSSGTSTYSTDTITPSYPLNGAIASSATYYTPTQTIASPYYFANQQAMGLPVASTVTSVQHLDPNLVRSIVERLLDYAPLEPPVSAFAGAVAGLSGRPAFGGRHPGLSIREDTLLPPFTRQIEHLIGEIRAAKQRGKPLLVEGIPGLGKASALQKWVWEEGQRRPAIYLQLSLVLRKRHGGSSLEDEGEEDTDFYTETETENEGLEERVQLSVRRDAFRRAVESALGVDGLEASMISMSDSFMGKSSGTSIRDETNGTSTTGDNNNPSNPLSNAPSISIESIDSPVATAPAASHSDQEDSEDEDELSPRTRKMDMSRLDHVAQALRLIAAKSKHGPTLLVMDDVQLLFRERKALSNRYEGIAEVFAWCLRCEGEGILDFVMCSSEKSAVGGIKRLKGYDWGLTLHSVDGVEDDVIIEYLLKDVNPKIREPQRKFTPDTAALFVATFNGSLLELDNYVRDLNSNVFMFIKKRERSFLRYLQRHMPQRASRIQLTPPTSRRYGLTSPTGSGSVYDLSAVPLPPGAGSHQGGMSLRDHEDELRELFLDIIMRGGVLSVDKLDVGRMALAEALVERNILRWRDKRIRKREGRESMKAGWTPKEKEKRFGSGGSGGWYELRREEVEEIEEVGSPKKKDDEGETVAAAAQGMGVAAAGVVVGTAVGAAKEVLNILPKVEGGWLGGMFGRSPSNNSAMPTINASSTAAKQQQQQHQQHRASVPGPTSPWDEESEEETMTPPTIVDHWKGTENDGDDGVGEVRDLDASEQLAVFAREGAELVWSCNLVRTVCEAFVSGGTSLEW
ncbi:hypothetical protein HDU97_008177 [Phlyctochytrium planicorne]|nr:hypothetical protein HDU97_008177 [Phlyctochytrium planicorne]